MWRKERTSEGLTLSNLAIDLTLYPCRIKLGSRSSNPRAKTVSMKWETTPLQMGGRKKVWELKNKNDSLLKQREN